MDGRSCRCGLPRPCRWDKWVGIPPAIARAPSSHTRQRTTRSRAVDTSGVIMSTRHVTRPHISPGLPVAPCSSHFARGSRGVSRTREPRLSTVFCTSNTLGYLSKIGGGDHGLNVRVRFSACEAAGVGRCPIWTALLSPALELRTALLSPALELRTALLSPALELRSLSSLRIGW